MDWFLYDNGLRHERVKSTAYFNMFCKHSTSVFIGTTNIMIRRMVHDYHGNLISMYILTYLSKCFEPISKIFHGGENRFLLLL